MQYKFIKKLDIFTSMINIRCFTTCSTLLRDLSMIKTIVSSVKVEPADIPKTEIKAEKLPRQGQSAKNQQITTRPVRVSRQQKPEWVSLNTTYNGYFKQPTIQEVNKVNQFFNSTTVTYEWSATEFDKIPSELARAREHENMNGRATEKLYGGKTKIPFNLINELPEILFLGRSNAGKSSILNNLVTEFGRNTVVEAARTSKRAGFTKTLNCFNIGNKFRLIDSPGYGFRSTSNQGTVTMDYLESRKELRRCYVLVSANHGFTKLDLSVMEHLTSLGRPFEVVFTKMDKIKDLEKFKTMIKESGIQDSPTLPRLILTNSVSSTKVPKRYGIDHLRYSIFESCGLI